MARFRFPLESVLKLRRFEEEAARRALAETLGRVEVQKGNIRILETEREGTLDAEAGKPECDPAGRQRAVLYLRDLGKRLGDAGKSLRELEVAARERRAALHEAAKARQAMEKLRDRKLETFQTERRRQGYAEIDEMVLQRDRERG